MSQRRLVTGGETSDCGNTQANGRSGKRNVRLKRRKSGNRVNLTGKKGKNGVKVGTAAAWTGGGENRVKPGTNFKRGGLLGGGRARRHARYIIKVKYRNRDSGSPEKDTCAQKSYTRTSRRKKRYDLLGKKKNANLQGWCRGYGNQVK